MKKGIQTASVLLFLMLVWMEPAHAYLDPGTGSAITYLLVSIGAAVYFVIRGILYAIRRKVTRTDTGGRDGSAISQDRGIVIFSEGRDYWLTFKPVIDALIAKNCPFRYVTLDIEDPALAVENPLMQARYLGKGTAAFAKAATIRADVMLSTTPNIGCPGYPFPRPKGISCLAYVSHGIGDVSYLKKNALDYYDAVLMTGAFVEKSIRLLEELRGTKKKECRSCGSPHLDHMKSVLKKRTQENKRPVVLVAPSWGERGILRQYGTEFISALVRADKYDVIIRPHLQSRSKEPELLDALAGKMKDFAWVRFDDALDPSSSLMAADVLISENSGIRFEFAFLCERPVITVNVERKNTSDYEIADLTYGWDNDVSDEIGAVVNTSDLGDIVEIVERVLGFPGESLGKMREEYIANFGTAGAAVADWAMEKAGCAAALNGKG